MLTFSTPASKPFVYLSGATISPSGSSPVHAARISDGLVKRAVVLPDGNQRIVGLKKAGDWLFLECITSNASLSYSSIAIGILTVELWPILELRKNILNNTSELSNLADELRCEINQSHRWISEFVSGSVKLRVGRLLVYLDSIAPFHHSKTIKLLTVQEISEIVGARQETVSRILASLKRQRVLIKDSSSLSMRFHIAPEALNNFINQNACGH